MSHTPPNQEHDDEVVRLLVVDDDVAVRMQLGMALDGVEIVEAWRAGDIVATTVAERVDAVLLDRRLPDGDGLDAVRALRKERATADMPIVVLTADDDPAQRTEAFAAGADEHAVKPVDPVQLLTAVKALLALGKAQRRLRRMTRRARLKAGRHDGGWDDLLPAHPERRGRFRRRLKGD